MPEIDALFYMPAACAASVVAGRFCFRAVAFCGALLRGQNVHVRQV